MSNELYLLTLTAASIGFLHTLLGPDHYIPFIVMAKAGKWTLRKTVIVTILSGIGHVGSSIILGFIGIFFGIALTKLTHIESMRGELAGWLLIAFGLVYMAWGIKKAIRNEPHSHIHIHSNGTAHSHTHTHSKEHLHVHESEEKPDLKPWIIFTIFVFGPCEPLIPLIMFPAASDSHFGIALVSIVFGAVTIATMLAVVLSAVKGLSFIPVKKYEKYSHALAGAAILMSGLAVQFLGL